MDTPQWSVRFRARRATLIIISVLASGAAAFVPTASAAATVVRPPIRYAGPVATADRRLTTTKLRACEDRQAAIRTIMNRIADRGQKRLDLFSTIADRAETFYTSKGKTLADYATLLADLHTKATAAQTAVDALKNAGTAFSCGSTDPHGAVATFRADLQAENTALQAYRSAVRALIVGIKSVTGTTNRTEAN